LGKEGKGQNLEGGVMELCPLCGQLYSGGYGSIFLDERLRDVIIDGERIKLTHRMVSVFGGIVKSSPRTVTIAYLMDYVYGLETDNEPNEKIIHVFICRIRQKIKHTRFRIETVRGLGYRLVEKEGIPDGENRQTN
jgi:DNA-binding response OmpR family regulator